VEERPSISLLVAGIRKVAEDRIMAVNRIQWNNWEPNYAEEHAE